MNQWLLGFLLLFCLVFAGCPRWGIVNPHEHHYQQVQEHGSVTGHERLESHDIQDNPKIPRDLGLSDTPEP